MEKSDKIYVAGHKGLVGSALVKALQREGYQNLILRSHSELDLTIQPAVHDFFMRERPDYVILAAAKVGGILANNTYRAEFIYSNLMIQNNVIHSAWQSQVKQLLFLGSSCIYPRDCPQPMREEHLLTSPLEATNEPYAIAKIAGAKMCEAYNSQYGTRFFSVMPTNLYGPNDNFDLATSHVVPALLRKIHEAKIANSPSVIVWGSGKPKREFLYVDDMASACLFLLQRGGVKDIINIGSGMEVSIQQLAEVICDVVGFNGNLMFDTTKPDGTPRKFLEVTKLSQLGWTATTSLKEGLHSTYQWFLQQKTKAIADPV